MNMRLLIAAIASVFVFSACSQHRIQTIDKQMYSSDGSHLAVVEGDTVTFEEEVAGHLAMPDSVQTEIRDLAEAELVDYLDFEQEVQDNYDSIYRSWYQAGNVRKYVHRGVGLGNSLIALGEAVDIDPSFVEAWSARGRLACEAGDLYSGLDFLNAALVAARARTEAGRPVDEETMMEIYRERAWALRDLAQWGEGLAAVREGLEFKHGDHDLVLIKGLLLAGAGRYSEAVSLAVRMPPFSYPRFGLLNRGLEHQTSTYANLWIKSQALMAIGDYDMAFKIIGNMDIYPYRGVIVHSDRFWNDVGLVAELAGVEDANIYYAIGYITRKYDRYYAAGAFSMGPMVLDVPNSRMPCYTSFGNRFHVAGSPFSYIAVQMNQMALGVFETQKMMAAGRALQALEIAERRNIRPDVCRALRGRIFYAADDYRAAHAELKAAREEFRRKGSVDAGTSMLLGMLELQGFRYQAAARYLEESVEKDPASAVGWRSLGVVYANLGLRDQAIGAMDKALEIQPYSVSGLYNRGLYHYQNQDYLAAVGDLNRAQGIEPDNREVQRLLRMAGQGHVAQGGSPADLPGLAGDYEYDIATGETVSGVEVDPAQLLAQLESDIEGFFTVPDSLEASVQDSDTVVADLEELYAREGDPRTRKMLALAYIDKKELVKAQALLAPGWGVDLEPDEEVMLLYADRMLGEQERARLLAEQLASGEASTDNPYIWAMTALTIRDDPRAWKFSVVNATFLGRMSYGIASETSTSVFVWSTWMRVGFSNMRASIITPEGDALPIENHWLRNVQEVGMGVGKVEGSPK